MCVIYITLIIWFDFNIFIKTYDMFLCPDCPDLNLILILQISSFKLIGRHFESGQFISQVFEKIGSFVQKSDTITTSSILF